MRVPVLPCPTPRGTLHGTAVALAVGVEEIKGAIQAVVRVTVEIEGGDKPACVVDTISRHFPEG